MSGCGLARRPVRRIDLGAVDRQRFNVEERGGAVLVKPHKAMHRWESGEEHLRSLYCTPAGEVLSAALERWGHLRDVADRKTQAVTLKAEAPAHLFPLLMAYAAREEVKAVDLREAFILGVTATQLREMRKRGVARLVLDLDSARAAD